MHARAHGIPTTPLTSDTSTALLSSILTAKPDQKTTFQTYSAVKIKQEPIDPTEAQEAMDSISINSRNPSPGSVDMDDDDL